MKGAYTMSEKRSFKEVIDELGDINITNENTRAKLYYQKKLNKGYDKLFKLKKHLEFLKNPTKCYWQIYF